MQSMNRHTFVGMDSSSKIIIIVPLVAALLLGMVEGQNEGKLELPKADMCEKS